MGSQAVLRVSGRGVLKTFHKASHCDMEAACLAKGFRNVIPLVERVGPKSLLLPYRRGGDLMDRAMRGEMPKVSIVTDLSDALREVHAADIVHCDVKPENIMVRDDGTYELIDFGLASFKGSQLAGSTKSYSLDTGGRAHPDQDWWALGCTLGVLFSRAMPPPNLREHWPGSEKWPVEIQSAVARYLRSI